MKKLKKEIGNKENIEKEKNVMKENFPYIIAIIVVILIRIFLFTPIRVNGTSMVDTLHDRDTMILNKISMRFKDIERFQIVVIRTDESYLIKRVIGLPGETIKYSNGELFINGKKLDDLYNNGKTDDFGEVKIGKEQYFVMGDNRGNSIDSRIIGVINKKDLRGTTKFVLFPFKDMGNVE